jgi:hypothetical protein
MLDILGGRFAACDGIGRRNFLRIGALGLGSLTLADLLRARARGEGTGRCRAVIQVVLGGGPSHLETYDPKPDAPREVRGELAAIPTALPGVHLSELMPRQAQILDKMAIVRSLTHEIADHASGLHRIMTGYAPTEARPGQNERPSVGSIVARVRGASGPGVPPYVSMTAGSAFGGLFLGGAYLGAGDSPFPLDGDPASGMTVRDLDAPPGLTLDRLEDRRALLGRLDRLDRSRDASGLMDGLDRHAERAYAMITGPEARRALDLGAEPPRVRDRYGRTRIGQSCLLARRLVEAGVAFVSIAEGDWDHHVRVAQGCRRQAPPLDAAVAALVEDLADRGMADEVLVVAWGEFGRTPRINGAGGRDHWPGGMSAMLAGGGLRMGQVVGATTARGERPVERPTRPEDVVRTIYHALGIDPSREFVDETGRPRPVLNLGGPIAELVGA